MNVPRPYLEERVAELEARLARLERRIGSTRTPAAHPLDVMLERAAAGYGVSVDELRGPGRRRELVAARDVYIEAARAAGYSLTTIAGPIGRHHTSVMQALRRLDTRAQADRIHAQESPTCEQARPDL